MKKKMLTYFLFITGPLFAVNLVSQEHPRLILTKPGVEKIRQNLGSIPLFDASLQKIKKEVDAEIVAGMDIPTPKDYSGGYTHERHKRNFLMMQRAGLLFQILQEKKYAVYIRDMLLGYEAIYQNLPVHPKQRSYARGKLFWQCLNDANWLVYVSQAYDCIYDWLSKEERRVLEKNLFKPFADYISIQNPQFFNRIHNHSTWGNAAVGMIGLVMGDDELVNRALYGIQNDSINASAKDNDGGFIKTHNKAGFFANLDEPFSPDGYYTEGPYYQRYAMYPFLIFAVALNNARPELKIFKYKDSVLLKSVKTLVNLTDQDGEFFPINDAQKGMSYQSRELVTAIDIAYHYGSEEPGLLDIAKKQNRVVLNDSGLDVAKAIADGKEKPFLKRSVNFSDGSEGKQGGIAVLRNSGLELLFKYTAQGLSHGHYDKLSFMLYEDGEDVIQDYGMARFVNIEEKGGGNYLKENRTWAKQTIAHNTLVVNETSHFAGKYELGSKHHSDGYLFSTSENNIQVVSGKENNAYPGVIMHRTMALIDNIGYEKPLILDLFRVTSDNKNDYDFPLHFMGQVIQTNFEFHVSPTLNSLGTKNGYQHLYLEGKGEPKSDNIKLLWLRDNKFYTWTSVAKNKDELLLTRLGANDPEFNLRRDASLVIRRRADKNTLFASVIESHGKYSPVSELSRNSKSNVKALQVVYDSDLYTAVTIALANGKQVLFILSNKNGSYEKKHTLSIDTKEYQWTGPYLFTDIK